MNSKFGALRSGALRLDGLLDELPSELYFSERFGSVYHAELYIKMMQWAGFSARKTALQTLQIRNCTIHLFDDSADDMVELANAALRKWNAAAEYILAGEGQTK